MAKVLVVDDHPVNRNLVVTLLGYRGHTVLEASDGAEALAKAESEKPELIITDLLMPVMDGYELVRELRASPSLASTPVIFYTANYLIDEARPLAAASGVRHILPKPAEPERLLAIVDEALAEQHPVPPVGLTSDLQREHLRALSAKLADKVRELEATQAALIESEARFRSFAESSPMGIFSLDAAGQVSYGNPRLRQICGQTDDQDAPLRGWTELLHPDDRDRVLADLATAVAASNRYTDRARVVRPGGEARWVDVQAAPVLDDTDPPTFVGTVEDVTAVLEAQQQRAELEARLRTSERLESIGQLAAGVAHDFNNLLGAMLNYADFVSSGIDDLHVAAGEESHLAQIREDSAALRRAAERGAELTHQLLIFGRREILHPVVLDANELVRDATKLLGRTIGEHISLQTRLDPELWPVSGDRSRLEQVIVNLVVNARDAIGDAGTVVITTDNVELGQASADMQPDAKAGRYTRLTVTDSGSGMAPETIARALEPFFTTKPRGKGTGLGLATVYGVVNQLGGYLAIDSEVGTGTAVQVCLPATDRTPSQVVETMRAPAAGHGEAILVVDDDDDLGATTARILAKNGYTATCAAGPAAAVTALAEESLRIDLILTDVVMPDMSGRELAEIAARTRPGVPVLFMSGYPEDFLGSEEVAPMHVVAKPFSQASLLRSVATALGRTVDH